MVCMVARLRIVLSCLLVASLAGCGGGSHATSSQDALTIVVDMGGSAGTGGGPGGVGGGSGGTGGQLAATTSAAPGVCVPGASVACACVTGQQGAQVCTAAGTFAACVCAPPTVDAGNVGGSDGAATSPPDASAAAGGSDARPATGGIGGSDAPLATGGTGAGGTAGTGTTPAIVSFTASPATIFVGYASTLSWTVTGATMLTIDQGAGSALISVLGTTSLVVTPKQTTTYTLTLNGSVSAQVTVAVSIGVTFSNGQAQGQMNGLGWVSLGPQDGISDPVCNPTATAGASTQAITNATPCPTTGQTVWNSSTALCISGSIPKVQDDTAFPTGDYTADWGLQIGVNTSNPPGTTLGTSYSTIALNINPSAVTPANTAIRAIIHLVSMTATANPYCATITTSGAPIPLTSFNTACWDNSGTALLATDVPNIDKVSVLIPSDLTNAYTVSGFCLTGITFGGGSGLPDATPTDASVPDASVPADARPN